MSPLLLSLVVLSAAPAATGVDEAWFRNTLDHHEDLVVHGLCVYRTYHGEQ